MIRRCPQCGTEYPDGSPFCGVDGALTVQVPAPGEPADPRLGARYGNYVVTGMVADGAMGRVYEARHADTREHVALKVLHEEVAKDRIAVERFKREYETAQSLESPFIVRMLDHGEIPAAGQLAGSWYLAMEFLQGRELGAILRAHEVISIPRVLRMMCQVALGLDDAHSFGVIHRDLKPDNLYLCEGPDGDQIRLLDFGSVKLQLEMGPKLTAFGTTLGSPYYMSPEQAMGKRDIDQRADLFSLGSILYEVLCGRVPHDAERVAHILMMIVNEPPTPVSTLRSDLPPGIDDFMDRALAKDKTHRFGNALEFAAALLTTFGLAAEPNRPAIEAWARRPVAEIEAMLASAAPPQPRPFGAPTQASETSHSSISDMPSPVPQHNALLWVGIGAAVLLGLGGLGILFLW